MSKDSPVGIEGPSSDAVGSAAPRRRGLFRSAGAFSSAVLISRLLGLAREMAYSHFFGAGAAIEAYLAAQRFPNLLRDLLAENALAAAMTPVLAETEKKQGEARAREVAGKILGLLLAVGTVLTLLGIGFAPLYVPASVPGFADRPAVVSETITLTRILFPFLILVSLTAFAQSLANLRGRFFLPGLAPAAQNAVVIAVPFLFLTVGHRAPIAAMAWGTLAGAAVGVLLAWSPIRSGAPRPADWRGDPEVRRVLTLAAPVILGIAATQIGSFLSNQFVASYAGPGAMAYLNYAFRVTHLPLGLVAVPIGSALLPRLARDFAGGDEAAYRHDLRRGLAATTGAGILAGAGLAIFAVPIVSLLFAHGSFGAAETQATAAVLVVYAAGIPFFSANRVLAPALYARKETRRATMGGVLSVFLNLSASAFFVHLGWGAPGVAWGAVLGGVFQSLFLLSCLRCRRAL